MVSELEQRQNQYLKNLKRKFESNKRILSKVDKVDMFNSKKIKPKIPKMDSETRKRFERMKNKTKNTVSDLIYQQYENYDNGIVDIPPELTKSTREILQDRNIQEKKAMENIQLLLNDSEQEGLLRNQILNTYGRGGYLKFNQFYLI